MSVFSKLGKWVGDRIGDGPSMSGLKSSIKGSGKFIGNLQTQLAPVASLINPAFGAAMKGTGELLKGNDLKTAAVNAGKTYLGGKAVGKIPGVSKLGDIPGVDKFAGLGEKVGGFVDKLDDFPGGSQIGGALRGVRDQLVGGAKNALSGGLSGNLGQTLLAGAGGISAINAQNRANDLEKRALDSATSAYDERAPLRSMGLSLMQDQQAPTLAFAGNNAGNPYGAMHGLPKPAGAPATPAPGGFSPAAPLANRLLRRTA